MSGSLNGTAQRATPARARKEAAKRLGFALAADYRRLLEAQGDDAVVAASVTLGQNFNDNIEFICWVLKEYGGVTQMPFQPPHKTPGLRPTNDLPKLGNDLTGVAAIGTQCTCPMLEPDIIGADRHMTSCPQYRP